jgi:hypothetical protein
VSAFAESTTVESVDTVVESTAVESVVVDVDAPFPQDATKIAIVAKAKIVAFFIIVLFVF